MHKVYEIDDMIGFFKKRYCRYCGNLLKKEKTKKIIHKGDKDHKEYCNIGVTHKFHGDILVIGVGYYCEHCKKCFSMEEQHRIAKAQRKHKKKIISDIDLEQIK